MESVASVVYDLAEKYFGDYKVRNGQIVAKRCPFCGGGNNGDYDTFAIGLANGLWNCMRGSCKKKSGNLKELCEYFGESEYDADHLPQLTLQKKTKTYVKPEEADLFPATEEIYNFFEKRAITKETVDDWKIKSDKNGNIVFTFYRENVLTYVKYRQPKNWQKIKTEYEALSDEEKAKRNPPAKEWAMGNTEPILYGMNNVSFNKPLVICEGEIDALSLYQAGVTNVVSVPSGAKNMDWITNAWSWLQGFNQIVLFGDSDEPGLEMVQNLSKRLGEDRCMRPEEYPELIYMGKDYGRICKDANEILMCYGTETLKNLVDSCEPAPIDGVVDVGMSTYSDPSMIPRIMTKIPGLDRKIGGLKEGGLTVLSGQSGQGKSTISGVFILNAIEQGYNVCAFSGELSKDQFIDWICHQAVESKYIGYRIDQMSGKTYTFVSDDIRRRVQKWMAGHLFLIENDKVYQSEDPAEFVTKKIEALCRRYGCKLALVDNLMMLTISGEEENRAQQKVTARLKGLADAFKVQILLVAHPRKKSNKTDVFTTSEISGASAVGNLADTILNIEKPNIRVAKDRVSGTQNYVIQCSYDPVNHRIFQGDVRDKVVYSWDHTGVQEPENPAIMLEEFAVQKGAPTEETQPF